MAKTMRTELEFLLIGLGGALGAMTRYAINVAAIRWTPAEFPFGTLIANLTGCFLIGLLIGSGHAEKSDPLRLGLGVGFLGALTTFSTFGAETMGRFTEGHWPIAITNILANLILGLACVAVGFSMAKRIF
jgi:CrcB protein